MRRLSLALGPGLGCGAQVGSPVELREEKSEISARLGLVFVLGLVLG